MNCYICKRIEMIKKGTFPFFIKELDTGYLVLGDHQYIKGNVLFIAKDHIKDHDSLENREAFMKDLFLVEKALKQSVECTGVDLEYFSNNDHLMWELFPREYGDVPNNEPVYSLHKSILYNSYNILKEDELNSLINTIRSNIEKLL